MRTAITLFLLAACGATEPYPSGPDSGATFDAPLGSIDAPAETSDAAIDIDAPAVPLPRHIEIYSGDGQMAMEAWPAGDFLKVLVADSAGTPIPDVLVSWEVTSGHMYVTGMFSTAATGTSRTDANGLARVGLRGAFESQPISTWPSTIRATIAEGSVDFHAMSTYYTQQVPAAPQPYITTPESHDFGIHAPGTIIPNALEFIVVYQAGDQQGRGVPGIGTRFLSATEPESDAPSVLTCANSTSGLRSGGTFFTDAMGNAHCDLRVPTTPGIYQVGLRIGGLRDFGPYTLRVQ